MENARGRTDDKKRINAVGCSTALILFCNDDISI